MLETGRCDTHLRFETVDKVAGVCETYSVSDFCNVLFGTDKHSFRLAYSHIIQILVKTFSGYLFKMCGEIRLSQSEFLCHLTGC